MSMAARRYDNEKSQSECERESEWAIDGAALIRGGANAEISGGIGELEENLLEHLEGQYKLYVIDLMKTPQLAQNDQILAIPTLVRKLPQPIRKIIGICRTKTKYWWA